MRFATIDRPNNQVVAFSGAEQKAKEARAMNIQQFMTVEPTQRNMQNRTIYHSVEAPKLQKNHQ